MTQENKQQGDILDKVLETGRKKRRETTIVVNPDNYLNITNAKNVGLEQFLELQNKAKALKGMQQGMQSPETIPYMSLGEMSKGEEVKVVFVTRIVEERIEESTGEQKMLAVMVLMLEDGSMIRNAAFLIGKHFFDKVTGYAAKIVFKGTRKTATGNKMDDVVIYPLYQTA